MTALGTRAAGVAVALYLIFVSGCPSAHSIRDGQDGGAGDGCVAGSSGCRGGSGSGSGAGQGNTGGAGALGGLSGAGGSGGAGRGGYGGAGGEPVAGRGGAGAGGGGQGGAGTGGECVNDSDCRGSDPEDYDPCCGCVPECFSGTCNVICNDYGCCYSSGCSPTCEQLPPAVTSCPERILPVACNALPPDCPQGTFPASDAGCCPVPRNRPQLCAPLPVRNRC